MKDLEKLARGNPLVVIGVAGVAGWLLGSGVFALPFSLPSLAPHPTTPAAPAAPATLPASSAATAALATTSATMPTVAPTDPFAGWSL